MPILLSSSSSVDYTYSFRLKKLDVSIDSDEEVQTLLKDTEENGGSDYLNTIQAEQIAFFDFNSDQAHKKLIDNFLQSESDIDLLLWERPSP